MGFIGASVLFKSSANEGEGMGMAEGVGMIQDVANESNKAACCLLMLIKNFHHCVPLEHSVRLPSFILQFAFW